MTMPLSSRPSASARPRVLALLVAASVAAALAVVPAVAALAADPPASVQCADVGYAGPKQDVPDSGGTYVVPGVGTFVVDDTLTFTPAEGVASIDLCVKGGNQLPRLFPGFTGGTVPAPISNFVYKNVTLVPEDDPATAVPGVVALSSACDIEGSFTVPTSTGVQYRFNGADVADGQSVGGPISGGVLTAVAKDGFVLSNPAFSQAVDIPAAADCPGVVVTPPDEDEDEDVDVDVLGETFTRPPPAGTPPAVGSTSTPPATLPFTGGRTQAVLLGAFGLIAAGVAAQLLGARRPSHAAQHGG